MTYIVRVFLYLLAVLCVTCIAGAQLISNPNSPVVAAQGVGGAFTAAAIGVDAPFWNPAGLAFGGGTQGRFAYQQPWGVSFVTHLAAAGSTMLPRKAGGVAMTIQTLGTRDEGRSLASETEISASHGFLLQQDIHSSLAFGYSLKFINYSLGESVVGESGSSIDLGSSSTFGLDVGATAQLWDRFWLAGAMKNINHPQMGSSFKRDLPRMLSTGIAYSPYYGVRTTFDLERELEGESQFKGGIQANIAKPLDIRLGIISNPNSFSAGFGLHWKEMVLDYAMIYHPVLAPSHLFGLGFDLDQTLFELWRAKQ